MAKLDWKNIDLGALLKSNIIRSNIVTIVMLAASVTGHSLPDDMQGNLTDLLTKLSDVLVAVGILCSSYHRAVAQPESVAVIVPKKTDAQIP